MRVQLSSVRQGVEFSSLQGGDVFNYAGEFYIRLADGNPTANAVEVAGGMLTHFGPLTSVFLESATLVIA